MFDDDKGFGFILPDDGGDDVFVHRKIHGADRSAYLTKGDAVTYEVEFDDRKNKYCASKCSGFKVGGGGGGGGGDWAGRGGDYNGRGGDYGSNAARGGDYGGPGSAGGGGGSGREMCADFKRGRCDRGDRCRYSHDDGGDNRSRSPGHHGGYGGYGGPAQVYGGYGGAPQGYGMPPQGYGMPLPVYGMPPPGYGMMPPGHGMAPVGYGGPPQGPALPPGWEQLTDPASGRPYFCNRSTGETSWTPPAAPGSRLPPSGVSGGPLASGGLPQGWEQANDPASGKPYFFNRATGATSWTPPM